MSSFLNLVIDLVEHHGFKDCGRYALKRQFKHHLVTLVWAKMESNDKDPNGRSYILNLQACSKQISPTFIQCTIHEKDGGTDGWVIDGFSYKAYGHVDKNAEEANFVMVMNSQFEDTEPMIVLTHLLDPYINDTTAEVCIPSPKAPKLSAD